jgi:hypothetical protein
MSDGPCLVRAIYLPLLRHALVVPVITMLFTRVPRHRDEGVSGGEQMPDDTDRKENPYLFMWTLWADIRGPIDWVRTSV